MIRLVASYIPAYIRSVAGSGDDDFLSLLDAYLEPPHDPNLAMSNVQIVWVDDDQRLGAEHIAQHGVTKEEVEEVLLEIPPFVEAKRSRDAPERTLFWGRLNVIAGSSLSVKTGQKVPFAT